MKKFIYFGAIMISFQGPLRKEKKVQRKGFYLIKK